MRIADLGVRRGGTAVLDGVTLDVPAGDITMVVGGDGAGKSTLLEAVVGLLPHDGVVERPAAERIGYMPAGAGSWPDLTVEENVSFVGGSYGLSPAQVAESGARLLTAAGLENASDRLAARLSGGMRTKLGFCLAMLHHPDLLVLDEPSTGVDPVSRVELWQLISEAAAENTAVLMSTSYLDEAERATTVLVLHEGRPLLCGTPDDLIAACPGTIVETNAPTRPAMAWRAGPAFREWWPEDPPSDPPVAPTLEDVCIVAALRAGA